MSDRLKELSDAGVSIWLDDLSRERLNSGNLAQLVAEKSVTGVTTNPTIFATALAKGEAYDAQMNELAASGADRRRRHPRADHRRRPQRLRRLERTYRATNGVDGRVSIEVEPAPRDADRGDDRRGRRSVEDGGPAQRA